MVKRLTVRTAERRGGEVEARDVRAAFDALVNAERIDLALSGSEWARLVAASPWPSVPIADSRSLRRRKQGVSLEVRLVEDDPSPVGLDTLTRIISGGVGAGGIRSLRVRGRLPHKGCGEEQVAAFSTLSAAPGGEMGTGLERLELQCEPHTAGE